MRRSQPRRDWSLANEKRDAEGNTCRNCGSVMRVELAHVLGREHDAHPPLRPTAPQTWRPYLVVPDRVLLLCGPATDVTTCHGKQHAGRLDVLRLLSLDEQLQAVHDAGSIESARIRLIPAEMKRADWRLAA